MKSILSILLYFSVVYSSSDSIFFKYRYNFKSEIYELVTLGGHVITRSDSSGFGMSYSVIESGCYMFRIIGDSGHIKFVPVNVRGNGKE